MRILLDQNLSPKLIRKLADIIPGLETVYDHGLEGASDPVIFQWAQKAIFNAIVSADRDFVLLVERPGPPPKIIRIERCDFPAKVIEQLLRREALRIHDFLNSERDLAAAYGRFGIADISGLNVNIVPSVAVCAERSGRRKTLILALMVTYAVDARRGQATESTVYLMLDALHVTTDPGQIVSIYNGWGGGLSIQHSPLVGFQYQYSVGSASVGGPTFGTRGSSIRAGYGARWQNQSGTGWTPVSNPSELRPVTNSPATGFAPPDRAGDGSPERRRGSH